MSEEVILSMAGNSAGSPEELGDRGDPWTMTQNSAYTSNRAGAASRSARGKATTQNRIPKQPTRATHGGARNTC